MDNDYVSLGIINQLLFIYRDTVIPKPKTIDKLLEDANKLANWCKEIKQ